MLNNPITGKRLFDFSELSCANDFCCSTLPYKEVVFFRDEYSRCVDMWNKVREEAVAVCVNNFLLPVLERESHERLLQEAKDYVIKVCISEFSCIILNIGFLGYCKHEFARNMFLVDRTNFSKVHRICMIALKLQRIIVCIMMMMMIMRVVLLAEQEF